MLLFLAALSKLMNEMKLETFQNGSLTISIIIMCPHRRINIVRMYIRLILVYSKFAKTYWEAWLCCWAYFLTSWFAIIWDWRVVRWIKWKLLEWLIVMNDLLILLSMIIWRNTLAKDRPPSFTTTEGVVLGSSPNVI